MTVEDTAQPPRSPCVLALQLYIEATRMSIFAIDDSPRKCIIVTVCLQWVVISLISVLS